MSRSEREEQEQSLLAGAESSPFDSRELKNVDLDSPDAGTSSRENSPLIGSTVVPAEYGSRGSVQKDSDASLDQLVNYYMTQISENKPLGWGELLKVVLEGLGGSAGIYYWPSADAYGQDKAPWERYSLIAGNTSSGILFLVNATDQFLTSMQQEWNTPKELGILAAPERRALIAKYIKILLGSVVCAIPFAIAVDLFPLPGCEDDLCLGLTVTHSAVANTILHAISWALIFTPQLWYYRLPLLLIEKAYAKFQYKRLTPAEKQAFDQDQEKEKIYQVYRNHLAQFYRNTTNEIITHYVKNRVSAGSMRDIVNRMRTWEGIAQERPVQQNIVVRESFGLWVCCAAIDRFLMEKNGAAIIGALFMVAGSMGWIANPFYLISESFGLDTAPSILLGLPPAYSMTVLSAFYGAIFVPRAYQFLTTAWSHPVEKLPLEARLYPKTFALFTLINGYLSFFSYATAEALVTKIFGAKIWDGVRPHLQNVGYPAMQLLSFMALTDLFVLYARKIAAVVEWDDYKMLARLQIQSEYLLQQIPKIKGEELMDQLRNKEDFRTNHLGIGKKVFIDDLQALGMNPPALEDVEKEPTVLLRGDQNPMSSAL